MPHRRCDAWRFGVGIGGYVASGGESAPQWGLEPQLVLEYRAPAPLAVRAFAGAPSALLLGGDGTQGLGVAGLLAELDYRELGVGLGWGGRMLFPAVPTDDTDSFRPAWLVHARVGSADGLRASVLASLAWLPGPLSVECQTLDISIQIPVKISGAGYGGFFLEIGYAGVDLLGQPRLLAKHRVAGRWSESSVYVLYGYRAMFDLRHDTASWTAHGPYVGIEILGAARH